MELLKVLRNEKPIFVIDNIEDKHIKSLISNINAQMKDIVVKLDDLEAFLESQLSGEYKKKIVLAKSLQRYYDKWAAATSSCLKIAKEEKNEIDKFEGAKKSLISNLQLLLKETQKFPVVSGYDVVGDDFCYAKKNHSIIILGGHNVAIIETIIKEIEDKLQVEGNFSEISPIELEANYSNVLKNSEECRNKINLLFGNRASKSSKLLDLVMVMENVGKEVVFFETCKKDMEFIGISAKDISIYEKELFKKYVPLKKQLSKTLKISFIDIWDVVVDETEYESISEEIEKDIDLLEE